MDAVAVSGLWPPRMLLFLSIEHLGVAISLRWVSPNLSHGNPSSEQPGWPLRYRAAELVVFRDNIVSPFDTCKASRHPLCFHPVLAFLGHSVEFLVI